MENVVWQVKWQVYAYYFASFGLLLAVATIMMNIAFQGFAIASNMWLSIWSSDPHTVINGTNTQDVDKRNTYLGVYAGLGLGQGNTTQFYPSHLRITRTTRRTHTYEYISYKCDYTYVLVEPYVIDDSAAAAAA